MTRFLPSFLPSFLLIASALPAQILAGVYSWNAQGGATGQATCMIQNNVYYWTFYTKNAAGDWDEVGSCEMTEDAGPGGKNHYTATQQTGTSFKSIDATTGANNCAGVMADGNTGGLQHQS